MPQRPPSHQKKSTRPPCPRSGEFSPCRAGAARAPAKGAEPAEGARAMRRDTRGAAAPSAHRSIPGAAGEARGGMQRGAGGGGGVKSALSASFSAGPGGKWKTNAQSRERGVGSGVGAALPGDGKVRGGGPKGTSTSTVSCPRWGHLGRRPPSAGRWQLAAAAARARRPRTPPAPAPGPRGCREQSFPVIGAGGGARAV